VLTQSPAPRARAILGDIARGKRNAGLQEQAIHVLGTMGRGNGPLLSEIYASTASEDGSRYGRSRSRTPFTTEKTRVDAPMASVSAPRAAAVASGVRVNRRKL